jgi:hypothetical protein
MEMDDIIEPHLMFLFNRLVSIRCLSVHLRQVPVKFGARYDLADYTRAFQPQTISSTLQTLTRGMTAPSEAPLLQNFTRFVLQLTETIGEGLSR